MTPLERSIERTVKFKSVDSSLPDREWVLGFNPQDLRVRRKGDADGWKIDWYRLVGFLLIHGQRFTNK